MLCSDKPGHHDFNLLKKLVLSDGSILRAKLPGRPTRDCLLLHLFYNYHFSFQSYFFHVIGILYILMIGDSLSIIQRFQDYIKQLLSDYLLVISFHQPKHTFCFVTKNLVSWYQYLEACLIN